MAAPNHKLTQLLKGKTIRGTSDADGGKTITFDDESVMTVKVKPSGTNAASTGGAITQVWQDTSTESPTLRLEMDGNASLQFDLAEATSSVLIRSKDGEFLYSD